MGTLAAFTTGPEERRPERGRPVGGERFGVKVWRPAGRIRCAVRLRGGCRGVAEEKAAPAVAGARAWRSPPAVGSVGVQEPEKSEDGGQLAS